MKNIQLTDLQIRFLEIAINLKDHLIPLRDECLTEVTFKLDYGFSKKEMGDSMFYIACCVHVLFINR